MPKGDNPHGEKPDQNHDTLEVTVLAPGFIDPRPFSFRKNMTVAEAAREAAEAFGYRANTPGFQNAWRRALARR